jgi:hypothetical protein
MYCTELSTRRLSSTTLSYILHTLLLVIVTVILWLKKPRVTARTVVIGHDVEAVEKEYVSLYITRIVTDSLAKSLSQTAGRSVRELRAIHIVPVFENVDYSRSQVYRLLRECGDLAKFREAEISFNYKQQVDLMLDVMKKSLVSDLMMMHVTTLVCHATLAHVTRPQEAGSFILTMLTSLESKVSAGLYFGCLYQLLHTACFITVYRNIYKQPSELNVILKALITALRLAGPYSAATAILLVSLAMVLAETERREAARRILESLRRRLACEADRSVSSPSVRRVRGVALHNLATMLVQEGRWPEAYLVASELRRVATLGPETTRLLETIEGEMRRSADAASCASTTDEPVFSHD